MCEFSTQRYVMVFHPSCFSRPLRDKEACLPLQLACPLCSRWSQPVGALADQREGGRRASAPLNCRLTSYTAALSVQQSQPHGSGNYSLPWLLQACGWEQYPVPLLLAQGPALHPAVFLYVSLMKVFRFEDVISFLLEHWLKEYTLFWVKKGENVGTCLYFLVNA